MKTRNMIKLILVLAAGIYLIYRSWDELERMTDDVTILFGAVLIVGLLALAIGRVLRA